MELYTIQLAQHRLLKNTGIEIIDTTLKSGDVYFAPTRGLLTKYLSDKIDTSTYVETFKEILIKRLYHGVPKWQELLNKSKIALSCYCNAGEFCHRHLLVDMLVLIAKELDIPVQYKGEYTKDGLVDKSTYEKVPTLTLNEKEMITMQTRVASMTFRYKPEEDGLTHINIYSRGRTELGRKLSNLAPIGFTHPKYGHFNSVEGFWYYLSTGKQHEELRKGSGAEVKYLGRSFARVPMDRKEFMDEICRALVIKIYDNLQLRNELRTSELPLTHYYLMGSPPHQKVIRPVEFDWIVDTIDFLRWELVQEDTKLIIAGSRTITDPSVLMKAIMDLDLDPTEIVSGGAKGVDLLGEQLANRCSIKLTMFKADWDTHGKKAGILRNMEMGDYADRLLALWDGKSQGTKHMIEYMKSLNKPVDIVLV